MIVFVNEQSSGPHFTATIAQSSANAITAIVAVITAGIYMVVVKVKGQTAANKPKVTVYKI